MDLTIRIAKNIIPIRTFRDIEDYLKFIRNITQHGSKSPYFWFIRRIQIFQALSVIKLFLAFILIDKNNQFLSITFGDYTTLTLPTDRLAYFLEYQFYNLFGIIFYQLFYLSGRTPALYVLFSRLTSKFLPMRTMGEYSSRSMVVWSAVGFLNSVQLYTALFYVYLGNTIYLITQIYRDNIDKASHPILSTFSIVLSLVFHFLSFVNYIVPAELIIALIFWMMACFMMYYRQLKPHFRRANTNRKLDLVMSRYNLMVRYFFRANYCGSTVCCLFMLSAPLSAYLIMLIFLRTLSWNQIILQILFSHCFTGILIFHCVTPSLTRRMHKPGTWIKRYLVHWRVKGRECLTIRIRIRMWLFYEKYSTKNRYCVTYANFGNITTGSFCKWLLLYSEFLMYFYRFILLRS